MKFLDLQCGLSCQGPALLSGCGSPSGRQQGLLVSRHGGLTIHSQCLAPELEGAGILVDSTDIEATEVPSWPASSWPLPKDYGHLSAPLTPAVCRAWRVWHRSVAGGWVSGTNAQITMALCNLCFPSFRPCVEVLVSSFVSL